jgi:hypothetical protein
MIMSALKKVFTWALAIQIILMLSSCYSTVIKEDMRKVVQLTGYWKFSVGDDPEWAEPGYDDSDWDEIRVPGRWEDHGYPEYNGFAWYRRQFKIYDISDDNPVYLMFGRIDDADEVYLNGKLLAKCGKLPPDYESAYNIRRQYLIPLDYLNINEINTIAVRVYDSYMEGGIVDGPAGIFTNENNEFLDKDLSGQWKFHLGDNKQWKSAGFNDEMWENINVPAGWENQGYADYDGYAWYRKEFTIPAGMINEDLYLSLGKIDDYDYVYLNGKAIGSVFDLKKDGEYSRRGQEYNARRIYHLTPEVLKKSGKNILAVRVYDGQWSGGIYEGPIGLMTQKNMKAYKRKHYHQQSFGNFIIDQFIDNKE